MNNQFSVPAGLTGYERVVVSSDTLSKIIGISSDALEQVISEDTYMTNPDKRRYNSFVRDLNDKIGDWIKANRPNDMISNMNGIRPDISRYMLHLDLINDYCVQFILQNQYTYELVYKGIIMLIAM